MSTSAFLVQQSLRFISVAFALTVFAPAASAASGPWQSTDFVEARLVSAIDGVGQLDAIPLGVELRLKDKWKTYWRSPGDAGLPPVLDWAGSNNLKSATLSYPRPHRFELLKQTTFGYKEHVVFPLRAALTTPGQPLDLKAKLDVLVCADICVPQSLDLVMAIPAGAAVPGEDAQLLNQFQTQVPSLGDLAGLQIISATASGTDNSPTLEITAEAPEPFTDADVFAELEPPVALGAPSVQLSNGGRRAVFTLKPNAALPVGASLAGRPVTLTLIDGDHAIERTAKVAAGAPISILSWLAANAAMFGFALIGGLILNLMPCVLPVLSLKLMSVVKHGHAPPAQVRANFLATAAGIVFSLMLLAGILIALKSAGLAVGWGTQFQQPVFIAAMAVVVTLFACNMWGLFEIILPSSVSNLAGTAGGDGDGVLGSFIIGVFATLLATPCSAPFVGTAVGFALSGGTAQILTIFFALGLGLALPYLAVAAFPSLARLMPKPGMWMVRLRQVLSLALAGTVVWLLSILPEQIGLTGTLTVAVLLLALVAVLALGEKLPSLPPAAGRVAAALIAIGAVALPLFLKQPAKTGIETAADHGAVNWAAFDRDQIKSLISQGKTVFVDVTAEWCVVCKSNKKLVINTADVSQRLVAATIPMRADWTSPDPKISAFLASFGRYGIPLNVVFGPGAPGGILLPELLTKDAVFKAIEQASGKAASLEPVAGQDGKLADMTKTSQEGK